MTVLEIGSFTEALCLTFGARGGSEEGSNPQGLGPILSHASVDVAIFTGLIRHYGKYTHLPSLQE